MTTPNTDKHTPGPWRVPMGEFDLGNDGSRRIMSDATTPDGRTRIGTADSRIERIERGKNKTPYDAPDPERDANALLMRAAPDMLAALRTAQAEIICLLPRLGQPYAKSMKAAYDIVTAAIARATTT